MGLPQPPQREKLGREGGGRFYHRGFEHLLEKASDPPAPQLAPAGSAAALPCSERGRPVSPSRDKALGVRLRDGCSACPCPPPVSAGHPSKAALLVHCGGAKDFGTAGSE